MKITDEYEGGSFDNNTFHIPKNDKDRKIQALIYEQLHKPVGKTTLLMVMGLLYLLESDTNKLLEETISTHSTFLTDKEKLHYQLHYASNDFDKFTDIVNKINTENKYEPHYYDVEFYQGLTSFLSYDYNELKDKGAQKAVKNYLENNPFRLQSSDDENTFFFDYGYWLRAYAAATNEADIDKALYTLALESNEPLKILAVLETLVDPYEPEIYTSKYHEKILKNKKVQKCLEKAYFNQVTSEKIKSIIKFSLEGFSDTFPYEEDNESTESRDISEALLTMSKDEKADLKRSIKEALKHEKFFRKPLLWWLLIRYF
jgi:hypothetical protein